MSEVPKHPWLARRGSVYYLRAPVPKDIAETFGKREITYSLRTNDVSQARTIIDVEAADVRRQFDDHRAQILPCSDSRQPYTTMSPLSPLALQHMCDDHYQSVIDEDFSWRAELLEQVRRDGQGFHDDKYIDHPDTDWYNIIYEELAIDDLLIICVREQHQKQLHATEKLLALADISEHSTIASRMAAERDLHMADADRRRLARKLLEREVQARRDILSGDQSRYDAILERYAPRELSGPPSSTEPAKSDAGPHLSSLIEKFKAESTREGLATKTLLGDETDFREFISVAGDKPILRYTKADAVRFKEVLVSCPANRKSPKYRGLSISECAALAETTGVGRTLATSTINDKLNALSKLFQWADGQLEDVPNPFEGTRIKAKKTRAKRSEARLSFNTDELQRMFNSTVFTGCRSKARWKEPGDLILRDSAKFWAPLIALFSGLRLGEIVQMRTADIKTDTDGVQYFDVTTVVEPGDEEAAKSLKTTTSERQVPVHPFLRECGLQALIDKRRDAGEPRLLMDYAPSKSDGSWSKNFSGWFNDQFRLHLGIERIVNGQNRVSFHSFRHNFEDAVRDLPNVKQEVRDALQGHGENGVSAQYGTGVYRKRLDEAMKQVTYDGLDLSHLIVAQDDPATA